MFFPVLGETAAFRGFGKEAAGENFWQGTDFTAPFENPSL
jgi:hypothetical protein